MNWVELLILDEKGKETYHNSWVTSHLLSVDTVEAIIQAGRCRWKIENENNNTLKTKGYHLEHNSVMARRTCPTCCLPSTS